MYKIPLTNSPNQSFSSTIPVGNENIEFEFYLSYNDVAGYWMLTLTKSETQEILFSELPLLCSFIYYNNMVTQLSYKNFGSIYITVIQDKEKASMPDDQNIGSSYIMLWGDNE